MANETTNDKEWERKMDRARELGYEHGEAAGSWVFDGNTSPETIRYVLKGLEDGDPAVYDSLPSSPLSGEWADSFSLNDLADELDVSDSDEGFDDLCTEYEDGFTDGMESEVVRSGKAMLPDNDDESEG
jgi:hypothetical protein